MDLVPQYEAPRGIPVDQTLLSVYWLALVIVALIVGWELFKWFVISTSRKARRLARVRWRTADVVRCELERVEDVPTPMDSDAQTERPEPKLRQRRTSARQTGRRRQVPGDQQTAQSTGSRQIAADSQFTGSHQASSSSAGVDQDNDTLGRCYRLSVKEVSQSSVLRTVRNEVVNRVKEVAKNRKDSNKTWDVQTSSCCNFGGTGKQESREGTGQR